MSLKNTVIKYSKQFIRDDELLVVTDKTFVKAAQSLEKALAQEPSCKQEAQLQGMACIGTISAEEL
ncbi:hypothetical protein H8D85_00470 [bacterium]|nr:hypothetical protein [bacterium]